MMQLFSVGDNHSAIGNNNQTKEDDAKLINTGSG